MKYKYILPTLAAMGMLVASCSNDEFLSNVQGGSGQLVTVSASAAGGETRMAVTETASGDVMFTWENSDKLYVINPSNAEITPFALTEGAGKIRGSFSGTPSQAYTSGQKLMALFTHNDAAPATINKERNGIYLDLSGQDGTLTDKYQYMFGQGIYQSDGNVEFALRNLVSVVKATVNNLPQDETFSQIIFSDNNGSYRSNAYLMLQDGRHGDSEYHAGELVRKGVLDDFNGQWNERVQAEDDYESAITLNGSFSTVEGSLTKYFYIMETRNTDIHQNDGGSGVDRYEISVHNYIHPNIILIGENNLYAARPDGGKVMGAGKIMDLKLDAQVVPTLAINASTEVVSHDENGKEVMYAIKAESAGTYSLFFSGAYLALGNHWYGGRKDFELAAGEWAYFRFTDNTTVTVKCPQPLVLNQEYTVERDDSYTFTPTESGIYLFDGFNHGLSIDAEPGVSYENLYPNKCILNAGHSYKFNFHDNATFTFKKLGTGTLSLGTDNACLTSGYGDDNKTYYQFTASATGLYKFITNSSVDVLGSWPPRISNWVDGVNEVTMALEEGSSWYMYFSSDQSGIDTSVAIEYVGLCKTVAPGQSVNVTVGEYVLVKNESDKSNFYKIAGTATFSELNGQEYTAIQSRDGKILTCKTGGTANVSVVEFSEPAAVYTITDQAKLEAGKVYELNVPENYTEPVKITFFSDDNFSTIFGIHEYGYMCEINNGNTWISSGKIYILSPKDVIVTFDGTIPPGQGAKAPGLNYKKWNN